MRAAAKPSTRHPRSRPPIRRSPRVRRSVSTRRCRARSAPRVAARRRSAWTAICSRRRRARTAVSSCWRSPGSSRRAPKVSRSLTASTCAASTPSTVKTSSCAWAGSRSTCLRTFTGRATPTWGSSSRRRCGASARSRAFTTHAKETSRLRELSTSISASTMRSAAFGSPRRTDRSTRFASSSCGPPKASAKRRSARWPTSTPTASATTGEAIASAPRCSSPRAMDVGAGAGSGS